MPFGNIPNVAAGSIFKSLVSWGNGIAARAAETANASVRARGMERRILIVPQKGTKGAKGKTVEMIFFAPVAPFCAVWLPGFQMLWLYRLLFIPVLIVLAPAYLLRMRRRGGYGRNFAHRFGALPPLPSKDPRRLRVWLQAVSVGEVLAIGPILEGLHREGIEIY